MLHPVDHCASFSSSTALCCYFNDTWRVFVIGKQGPTMSKLCAKVVSINEMI